MKNIYKKIIVLIVTLILGILINTGKVEATSTSITANTTSPTKGQTVTVTGTVTAGAWNVTFTGAGQTHKMVGQTSSLGNESASKTITFTAGEPGTKYVFTLSGGATDFSETSEKPVSTKTLEITVANPQQEKPTPPVTLTKSSNANLKNLGIRPNDFSGFKSGTTTYNVTVPNNVTSVELYAVKQDAKATISGTGQKNLQEGVNKLSVVVTAEDGTKKTYTVNVTREAEKDNKEPEKEEETENKVEEKLETENNNEEIGEGLAELKIEGVELNKEFKIGEYEYTAKYIGEATSLNIEAIPSNESYVVEIIGNKDLKEGENIVTILVSDKDGNNIATYQITVNKSLVDEEAIAREEAKKQEEKKRNIIIFGSIASLVIIILIVVIIVKNKRKNSYGEDYSIPYSGINSENNPDNYYDNSNLINDKADDDFEEPVKKVKRNKGKRFK